MEGLDVLILMSVGCMDDMMSILIGVVFVIDDFGCMVEFDKLVECIVVFEW